MSRKQGDASNPGGKRDPPPEEETDRTRRLLAELQQQIDRQKRELAVMWSGFEQFKRRARSHPPDVQSRARARTGREGDADVLVVDDDPDLLATLGQVLDEEGFSVATASSGPAALDYLRANHRPAALVVDLMLPGMSGADLLRELLGMEPVREAAVVVFTAASENLIRAAGIEPALVVRKPSLPTLLERLREAVHGRGHLGPGG